MKKWNLMLIFILLAGGGFVFSQSITVIQPNGGEELAIGSSYEIKWNAVGNTNPFLISLWKDVIRVSTIKSTTLCAGIGIKTFNWTVGNLEGGGKASAGPGYKVKVKERDVAVSDKSNGEFKIMLTSAPTADLIFTKLSVSPKSPTVLDTITLYFVIQNTGTERMEATQAKVEIKRNNGIKIREKIVNIFALDPNKTFSACD